MNFTLLTFYSHATGNTIKFSRDSFTAHQVEDPRHELGMTLNISTNPQMPDGKYAVVLMRKKMYYVFPYIDLVEGVANVMPSNTWPFEFAEYKNMGVIYYFACEGEPPTVNFRRLT